MQAVVQTQYGSPSVLTIKEVAKPIPKDGEVLIRVYATTVNRTDCAIMRAKPFFMRFFTGLLKPKKSTPGTDFAGKIEAIGKNVRGFRVGDNVFGFNDMGLQTHAQYTTISIDKAIVKMPSNMTHQEAVACVEGAHYAYNIIKKVKINPRQKILVNGASGAIGSATVQLLKHYNANVTAVCGTQNLKLVKELGAEQVIDYTKTDFTKTDQKFDFVFDTVGKSAFGKCKPILNPGGVYISSELGKMAQNVFFALITPVIGSKKVIFPVPQDIKGSLEFIKARIEEGNFKAVIDRIYPLQQVPDAFTYVETGQKTGNVVIEVDVINGAEL
ncbi:MAG: NAD(P)-dependent alcohol dehydrogenase [Saprospiraceae bacterium]|nr:NAD(P)-dependent alcohol dehydrogenase [Saprospiraceae bacterium]